MSLIVVAFIVGALVVLLALSVLCLFTLAKLRSPMDQFLAYVASLQASLDRIAKAFAGAPTKEALDAANARADTAEKALADYKAAAEAALAPLVTEAAGIAPAPAEAPPAA